MFAKTLGGICQNYETVTVKLLQKIGIFPEANNNKMTLKSSSANPKTL